MKLELTEKELRLIRDWGIITSSDYPDSWEEDEELLFRKIFKRPLMDLPDEVEEEEE